MNKIYYLSLVLCIAIFSSASAQWSVKSAPTHIIDVADLHFKNTGTGFAVGTNQIPNGNAMIVSTTSGGSSWTVRYNLTPSHTPSTFNFNDINFVTNTVAYAVGGYSDANRRALIAKTTDGGATWDTVPHDIDSVSRILHTFFFNANEGYCTAINLYKTTNGGVNWTKINTPIGFNGLRKVHFISSDTGFAIGHYDSFLIRSTDGGLTWSLVTIPTTENTRDIHFVDQKIGFISCDDGVILKTSDGGSNWSQVVNSDPDAYHVNVIDFASSSVGFAGTSGGPILRTTDTGATWDVNYNIKSSPLILFGGVQSIHFPSATIGYAGSSFQYIAKTTNAGGPIGGPGPSSVNELQGIEDVSIFPNPAVDEIFFENLGNSEKTIVSVKGLNGAILKEKILDSTQNRLEIGDLPSGVYFVEIRTETELSVRKLIKR